MKKFLLSLVCLLVSCSSLMALSSQNLVEELPPMRRPVDNQHPMWLIHIDVWNQPDPQKIINLIPDSIKPYVVLNLSLSCSYDKDLDIYMRPQNAVPTYKSWASIAQLNGMWFTCQPASGGHTHLQDEDLETFEYFFTHYPNFLGWNYAEQFWGFNESGDKSSSTETSRLALFAKLVRMSRKYGGFLTVSFCGNIWSHGLNPVGMMKRNSDLLNACKEYPESILWLYKYTTASCFYNNESVTFGPFIAGLSTNYGVRYDNCGWDGALESIYGKNHNHTYPEAAGFGTVMEQTCANGGAVWDGPELIWTQDFRSLANTTTSDGYQQRRWGHYNGFKNGWLDMFGKIISGFFYIPTREEVVNKTKLVVLNDVSSGSSEEMYAAWGSLYDNLYKQEDPFNTVNTYDKTVGQWMNNYCYFKKTGRYGAIPIINTLNDDLAKAIPVQVKKSAKKNSWSDKVAQFNALYPEVSRGDLFVNRYRNQLVTYFPYSYMNSRKTAQGTVPLCYNTCDSLSLEYGLLSSGVVHEYADHIDLYLQNYRSDTATQRLDCITVYGANEEPTFSYKRFADGLLTTPISSWDAEKGAFTLQVKHNGGVLVRINCAGKGENRATDVVPQAKLEIPAQPAAYIGPITIEAEDMDYKSIASSETLPYYSSYRWVRGHSGNGFVDMGSNTAGSLKHVLKLSDKGNYEMAIRYSNTSKEGAAKVTIGSLTRTVNFEKTEKNEWKKAVLNVSLSKGNNTIKILNSNGIAMLVDQIVYRPVEIPAEKFAVIIREGEHGSVTASVDSAYEFDKVSLEVTPELGYALAGWELVHGRVNIDENNTFTMIEDNVILRPLFQDMTLVYELDMKEVASDHMPVGWRVDQGDAIHEYPNDYSMGSRLFGGFTGYQGSALYWRDKCCEYGRQADYPLTLQPGDYKLTYAMAAWKSYPRYKTQILNASTEKVLASVATTTATPNANGSKSANVSSAKEHVLNFTVEEAGDYIISFTNLDVVSGYDEFLLLECNIHSVPKETDIVTSLAEGDEIECIFNEEGVKIDATEPGFNMIRWKSGKTTKLWMK